MDKAREKLQRWRQPSDSEIRAARRTGEPEVGQLDSDAHVLDETIWRHLEIQATKSADSEWTAHPDSDATFTFRNEDDGTLEGFSCDEGEIVDEAAAKDAFAPREEANGVGRTLRVVSTEDWIKLNVGGRQFTTTRTTLTKFPDCMLGRMFDDERWISVQDDDGAFLVDHDPNHFEAVLNYLRTGDVILTNSLTLHGVLSSAKFFQIMPMVAEVERQIQAERRSHYQYVVMRWGPTINPEAVWLYGPISERLSQSKEFENFHPRKLTAENLTFLEGVTFYDDVVVIMNVLGRHGWELVSSSTEKDGLKGQQFTFKKMVTYEVVRRREVGKKRHGD